MGRKTNCCSSRTLYHTVSIASKTFLVTENCAFDSICLSCHGLTKIPSPHTRPVYAASHLFQIHPLAFCLLSIYLEWGHLLGMAAVRPHCLLTKVNLFAFRCCFLMSDFLPGSQLKRDWAFCQPVCSGFSHVFTLKMQIKTASLEGLIQYPRRPLSLLFMLLF